MTDDRTFSEAYDAQYPGWVEMVGARSRQPARSASCAASWPRRVRLPRDLAGPEGTALDRLIAETVAWFRDRTDVATFERKTSADTRRA